MKSILKRNITGNSITSPEQWKSSIWVKKMFLWEGLRWKIRSMIVDGMQIKTEKEWKMLMLTSILKTTTDARMCYITSKNYAEVLYPAIIPLAQRLSFGVIIVIPAQSWNAMVFVDERFYYWSKSARNIWASVAKLPQWQMAFEDMKQYFDSSHHTVLFDSKVLSLSM